jgi:hypothetical protein
MTTIPTGKFMMHAIEPDEALAYIVGGADLPRAIPESESRARSYEPPFEMLPTFDEYEATVERFDEVMSSGSCSDAELRPKDRRPMH